MKMLLWNSIAASEFNQIISNQFNFNYMRITINVFSKKALLFCLLLLSIAGSAQNYVLTLANQSSTENTFDFDLMLTVPAGGKRIYSVSCGINFNAAILNGGTPSTTTTQIGRAHV